MLHTKSIYNSFQLGEMEIPTELDLEDEPIPKLVKPEPVNKYSHDFHNKKNQNEEPNKTNQKAYLKCVVFIECSQFDKGKLNFISSDFNQAKIITPMYHYSQNTHHPLTIQTKFFDLNKKMITYKEFKQFHDDHKGFVMRIASELFDSTILNMFLDYDIQVANFINNKNIKCKEKLLYNKSIKKHEPEFQNDPIMQLDFGPIKFKISKKLSKVTNYNISKKFPKVEEFNGTKNKLSEFYDIFGRILNDKKQVRFVFSPMTWVNGNTYGSYIIIHHMEIKFKDAKINSTLDNDSQNIQNEITSITI